MISAYPLGEYLSPDEARPCAWPGCPRVHEGGDYCARHRLRITRGCPPGVEGRRDRLVRAACELLLAESDADWDVALAELERAARRYGRRG